MEITIAFIQINKKIIFPNKMTLGIKDIIVNETNYTNAMCSCDYLYTFTSDREIKLKERLHKKLCKDPPVSEDFDVVSSTGRGKRAVKSQRQVAIDNAKRNKEFYED